jgi:cell division protease FtsH
MSDAVGPVAFRQGDEHPFLGKEMHEIREFSEETAHMIDVEIARILRSAQDDATRVLKDRRADLDRIADALIEKELLDRKDLTELLGPAATLAEEDVHSGESETSSSDPTDRDSDGKA